MEDKLWAIIPVNLILNANNDSLWTPELILNIVMVLIAGLSGLAGVIIGGRMNWKQEAKKLKIEKTNDKVNEMYIPLVKAIEAFIDDFYEEECKDMNYFDENRLYYYGGHWRNLKVLIKDAQSGSRRSLLNKEDRDLVDDLYTTIETFDQLPKQCIKDCFEMADSTPLSSETEKLLERDYILDGVQSGVNAESAQNAADRAFFDIINKCHDELRKIDKRIVDEKLPFLRKKLIAFIDASENAIE